MKGTHCKNGHLRSPENQYVASDGRPRCKQCQTAAQKRHKSNPAWKERRREKRHAQKVTEFQAIRVGTCAVCRNSFDRTILGHRRIFCGDKCKRAGNRRWGWIYNRYRLRPEQFDQMVADQGGACAICRSEFDMSHRRSMRFPQVDHDHKTGAVRGLLCRRCNTGLGNFNDDDLRILEAAGSYLMYAVRKERAA